MRCLIILLFTAFSVNVFSQTDSTKKINPVLQKKYLPDAVNGIYVNISYDDLLKIRPGIIKDEDASYNSMAHYVEHIDGSNITGITYQVDDFNIVYEMIFEYSGSTSHEALCAMSAKKFGKPNSPDDNMAYQWKVTLNDGLTLMFWVYENKFCIADASKF